MRPASAEFDSRGDAEGAEKQKIRMWRENRIVACSAPPRLRVHLNFRSAV